MLKRFWEYHKLFWYVFFTIVMVPWAFCYGVYLSIVIDRKFPNMPEERQKRIAMKHFDILDTKINKWFGY